MQTIEHPIPDVNINISKHSWLLQTEITKLFLKLWDCSQPWLELLVNFASSVNWLTKKEQRLLSNMLKTSWCPDTFRLFFSGIIRGKTTFWKTWSVASGVKQTRQTTINITPTVHHCCFRTRIEARIQLSSGKS